MNNIQSLKLRTATKSSTEPREAAEVTPEPTQAPVPPAPVQRRPETSWRTRALVLLVVAAAPTLGAVAASGTVHSAALRFLAGAVALTLAIGVVVETAAASARRRPRAAAAVAAAPQAKKNFSKPKAALVLMMCAGIAAYFGGAGTFAGFTAETTNAGSNIAAGTLTLNNTVNTGSACASTSGTSNDNVNPACSLMFSQLNTGLNPGFNNWEPTNVGIAKVTLENTGSLNASKLYLGAPYVQGLLSTQINSGSVPTSVVLTSGITAPIAAGDAIQINYGPYQNTWCAAVAAAIGATTITVNNAQGGCVAIPATGVAGGDLKTNARVQDVNSDSTATGATANTDCYDKLTTVAGGNPSVSGATFGSLGFNATTGNPLCNTLAIWVQEQTSGGFNYCWYGNTTGAPTGGCNAPISVKLSAGATIGTSTSSIAVNALNGNVAVGDSVVITEGALQSSCSVITTAQYIGATSIPVGSCTNLAPGPSGASNTFTTAATVTDGTVQTTLNGDSAHTLANFDTTTRGGGHIELVPVTANGVKTPNGVDLPQFSSGHVTDARTFYVGIYFPSTSAPENTLQALFSTFGVSWHIDQ